MQPYKTTVRPPIYTSIPQLYLLNISANQLIGLRATLIHQIQPFSSPPTRSLFLFLAVNGVQLQTLSANNMLNIIGASGLQASKIRSELAKAEITQNQAISAAQPIIHPSPFSSAQPTPPLPTSTAPYTGGMPPSAVTCGAYPAPGVYPAPIPGYVQPVNIIYQPALAPNAHHSITTKFSMALVILFTFLVRQTFTSNLPS